MITDPLADLHKTMRHLYALPPVVIALWVICHSSRAMTAAEQEQALAAGRWWVFVPGYWLEWSDHTIGQLQWPEGMQEAPSLFKKERP
jgi:hypothetical protein